MLQEEKYDCLIGRPVFYIFKIDDGEIDDNIKKYNQHKETSLYCIGISFDIKTKIRK